LCYQRQLSLWGGATKIYTKPDKNCPSCSGTGITDTGGFTPWGSPIFDKCPCITLVEVADSRKRHNRSLYCLNSKFKQKYAKRVSV
jgi:hypothetical protein